MRASDLREAQRLSDELAASRRLHDRMMAGESLHLTLGSGSSASGIDLSATYLARLRGDVLAGLQGRIKALTGQLVEMGVEP